MQSLQKFKNIKELFAYFSDEKVCLSYLEDQLWEGKPVCPHCGTKKVYRLKDGKNFKCGNKKECDSRFNVKVGTIYENSKLPLSIWFASIYLATAHKKGISSHQLARDLGITQKTAWFVLHRIREMVKAYKAKVKDVVQADEVFIGGLNKNRHAHKKRDYFVSGKHSDKTIVLGVMHQTGFVNTVIIPDLDASTIQAHIRSMVGKGSILITDDAHAYKTLAGDYSHVAIVHAEGEYARGAFSTNRLEGLWSLLQRMILGIYHNVSPKHLQRYCDEMGHRYNFRNMTDPERFHLTIRGSRGRLKYADLIKN